MKLHIEAAVLSEEECQQFHVRYRVCGFAVCWNAATLYLVRVPNADKLSAGQRDRLVDLFARRLPDVSSVDLLATRLQDRPSDAPVQEGLDGHTAHSDALASNQQSPDAGGGEAARVYTLDLKHLACVLAATFGLRVESAHSYADLSTLHWLLEPERSLVEHLAQLIHLFCPHLESKLTCMPLLLRFSIPTLLLCHV